ncbi:uncharacterized protein LOC142068493 [Caretta caretta]|uniref:uncharacterized protein LOC142068493 n=1 Tax=Caretta caretta TaxID=8467 RepID=UPI003F4BDF21
MQSSSAEVTMMESQNRKRAPAWTEREVRDLIAVWGEESVLSELRSSFRNAKTFLKISQGMKDRGHNRDPKQCRVKLKELRQAYQKTREANGRSGSEPQTCRFYDELHAILGGSATTTPAVLFDSFNGDGGNTEVGFGDEEDDDEEVVDSSQQASGETGFPDSQELFLTLDLEPVPPEPTQGCLLDSAGGEGTSAACVSMITGSSPSQRLVKLRKKKKRTRDEMFSELMLSSHTDRAQTNAWRQIMSECRKAQNDREERWRAEESKWRAEESKWRAEDRAEAQMWRQRDERRQDSMLRLLQDQTSMLQCMVELQQRQLEHRLPLQPLCNQPPSSPSSIASTPRRPRTRHQGIQIYPYLDNWLVKGNFRSQVQEDVAVLQAMCLSLCLLVNDKKSTLVPVQRIEFIGAVLKSTCARVFLPLERFQTLMDLIAEVSTSPLTVARVCLRLLGHMAVYTYVVHHARLRM